ncbi:MAG TPA: glutathione S-transferase family protein [Burkholderiaceae bacterium]|nr:glutathione S-transferase family protein [Burkholderiaceae bacterium]
MAIKLYSWPHSSGTRVSWALEELGLSYEYIHLDGKKLEHRTSQYLSVNPQGKVPGLVDGDLTFFESGAMLLYLGEQYGVERKLWPAEGGQARADAICWTVWAMADLGNYMMQYAYHGLDSPVSYKAEDRSKVCAEYNRSQFVRGLDSLQTRLQGREFLLDTFSLVDIPAASWLQVGAGFGIELDSHPRVADWLKRCSERAACRRAQ